MSTLSPVAIFSLHGPVGTSMGAIGGAVRARAIASTIVCPLDPGGSPSDTATRARYWPGTRLTPAGAPRTRKPGSMPLMRLNSGAAASSS